jgi:hypothetical protein
MVVGLGNGNTPVFGLDVKDFKTYDGIAAEVTILLARPRVVWNPPAVQPPLVDIDDEGGMGVANVPEPTASAIWGLGSLALLCRKKRSIFQVVTVIYIEGMVRACNGQLCTEE